MRNILCVHYEQHGQRRAPGLFQNNVPSVFSGPFCNLQSHCDYHTVFISDRLLWSTTLSKGSQHPSSCLRPTASHSCRLAHARQSPLTLECGGGLKLSLHKGHTYLWTGRKTSVMLEAPLLCSPPALWKGYRSLRSQLLLILSLLLLLLYCYHYC